MLKLKKKTFISVSPGCTEVPFYGHISWASNSTAAQTLPLKADKRVVSTQESSPELRDRPSGAAAGTAESTACPPPPTADTFLRPRRPGMGGDAGCGLRSRGVLTRRCPAGSRTQASQCPPQTPTLPFKEGLQSPCFSSWNIPALMQIPFDP